MDTDTIVGLILVTIGLVIAITVMVLMENMHRDEKRQDMEALVTFNPPPTFTSAKFPTDAQIGPAWVKSS